MHSHESRSARPPLANPLVRAVIATALLAALAAAVAFAMRDDGDDSGAATLDGAPTETSPATEEAELGALDGRRPIVGQPAPDFALRSLDGDMVRLSDFRGKVVWINFWATWCRPCKRELPEIQALYDEKGAEGLVVLEVNWKESAERAGAYWSDNRLSMPLLLDRGGSVYEQYGLQGLPDSFFVDREGNLAALHYGYLTEETMRKRLAAAGLP